jgi:hypothetical protein
VSKKGEQLELGATRPPEEELRDVWVDRLDKEFGIMLMPFIDKSYPVEKCREIARKLAELAAKRVWDVGALASGVSTVRCSGCDVEVDVRATIQLCERCGKGVRSAGSDG